MSLVIVEKPVEFLVDWVLISDLQAVQSYVDDLRQRHSGLSRHAIAQKIIDEQAWNNGLLGAATSFMGTAALPVTLPLDVIKTWKIQDFTIKAIAYLYGYTPQNADLKTAIFLLLTNGSLEELKQFAIAESTQFLAQSAFSAVDSIKTSTLQAAAKEAPKYVAEFLCKVCGWKMTEKVLQRSLSFAVPVLGAAIGGGVDWMTTQAVGNLAIEFFENSGMEFINSLGTSGEATATTSLGTALV